MKTDAFLDFQYTTAVPLPVTASALSADYIDQKARRDIGPGGGLYLATDITVSVAPTHGAIQAVTVTNATNIINLTAHGLPVGTPVNFTATTTPTNLVLGTTYYVTIPLAGVDADSFALAETSALAHAGTIFVLGGDGVAVLLNVLSTVEIQLVQTSDITATVLMDNLEVISTSGKIPYRAATYVTFTNATNITNWVAHGMSTGTPITYSVTGSGVLPVALTAGATYYVVWVSDDSFTVATSKENAAAGIVVALAGDGTVEMFARVVDTVLDAAGPLIYSSINPLPAGDIGERYLFVRYLCENGALSAGSFRSQLVCTPDSTPKVYPTGWAVQ